MPYLAIVGTEGTGKTVLVAALAKYLGEQPNCRLESQNIATQRYVSSICHGLSNQAWPPRTDIEMRLDWELRSPAANPIAFTWLDTPGQRLREVFARSGHPDPLPVAHAQLTTAIISADIVLVMINLADFVAEPDDEWSDTSEFIVKFLVNKLSHRTDQPHVALIIGQADLYPPLADQLGAKGIIQRYLPLVARAAGELQHCSFLSVSAVRRTEINVDSEGQAKRLPSSEAASEGIDTLAKWILDRVTVNDADSPRSATPVPANSDSSRYQSDWIQLIKQIAVDAMSLIDRIPFPIASGRDASIQFKRMVIAAVTLVILFMGCLMVPGHPKPQILATKVTYEAVGFFGSDGIISGNVRNDGATGLVTLEATWKTPGQKRTENWSQIVARGKTVTFEIRFKEQSRGVGTYEVRAIQK